MVEKQWLCPQQWPVVWHPGSHWSSRWSATVGGMKPPPFVEHLPCAVPCVKFFMSFNLPDPCRQFLLIPLGCGSLPDKGGFWGGAGVIRKECLKALRFYYLSCVLI